MANAALASPSLPGRPPWRSPFRPGRRAGPVLALGLALGILAGCTYRGEIDQPATLKATWFSYLNGDDIRSACADGTPVRYRLVYNGRYNEQLRAYEVVGDGNGGAYYTARTQRGSGLDLSRFSFDDPQALAAWTRFQTRLNPADLAALQGALDASGAFGPTPVGLRLGSEQFYWIASLCRDGRFQFNAWLYPSAGFARLRFPGILLAHDGTGTVINPPRAVPTFNPVRRPRGDRVPVRFDLEIGEDGLKGYRPIF